MIPVTSEARTNGTMTDQAVSSIAGGSSRDPGRWA
jgi:hypothetical protein